MGGPFMPPPMPPGSAIPNLNPPTGNAWNTRGDDEVGTPVRWHFSIDPLLVYMRGAYLPATLSTGDFLNDFVPGALGQPGTNVLNGNRTVNGGSAFGGRFSFIYWLADPEALSVDVSYFTVESRNAIFDIASDGNGVPVITRPFFNPVANAEDADPRALPAIYRGTAHDELRTQYQGAEANIRWNVTQAGPGGGLELIFLAGPRWFQLQEHYSNYDTVVELPQGLGNTYVFSDSFNTRNHFFGGQTGVQTRLRWERLVLDSFVKFVYGMNEQNVRIGGSTTVTDAFGNVFVDPQQALYAQVSNSSTRSRDRSAWGPEVGVNFGFQVTENFRFNVGYTFFMINGIVRPGDQIDRNVNIQPLLSGGGFGVARPVPVWGETTFYTQIVNFGFEFMY